MIFLMSEDSYNFWNLVIQAVIGPAIVATFVIYLLQLKAMRRASNGQNMLSIINYLQNPEIRKARDIVLRQLKGTDFRTWNAEQQEAATKVISSYDVASILVYQQRIVKDDSFLTNWAPSIIKTYEILEDFIKEMQKEENSGSSYWNDYKILYTEMKKSMHGRV